MLFLGSPAFRDRAFQCCGRGDGHAGRGGLLHEFNLRRGQAVGLIDEVAEGALQVQGFGGEGVGGRAEKLKLGKQKAEIARRRAPRSAAAPCPGGARLPAPRCRNRVQPRRGACCWAFSPPRSPANSPCEAE